MEIYLKLPSSFKKLLEICLFEMCLVSKIIYLDSKLI